MEQRSAPSQVRALAEAQWGVVSLFQLLQLGLTIGKVRTLIHREVLLRIFSGVYALGHRRLTMLGRLHAAQLAAGSGAYLSHRTAAAHRGLCRHPIAIELTIPGGHTPSNRPGLRIHRTRSPRDLTEARMHDGLLTATVPRIIIDLARTERPGEIQRLIRESIRTGQFDLGALNEALDAHPRRPGVGLARAALRRYLPGSEDRKSWLETEFQRHVLTDPRLPEPVYNQTLQGYEIDVMWAQQRVTLELDGRPYHVAVEDFDRDRVKDRALTRHGWRPLRASDFEWEHGRAEVLDDLYAVLGT